MNKKLTVLVTIVGAVFAGSGVWMLAGMRRPADRTVQIVQDGEVLRTIDLNGAEDQRILVEAKNDTSNTIMIEDGEIWISEAGCPDQTCVKMGHLRSGNLPIVCLPNKLIVRFADPEEGL